ncbi:hypothetical protein FRC09_008570, partial [Ceratobasidium sp. 395]
MSAQAGTGPPKRRGQYIARACNGCRRRRSKCDGVHPVCGACAHYNRECEWTGVSDARRPATKQLVDSLRVKIQLLEAEIEQLRSGQSARPALPPPQPSSPQPPGSLEPETAGTGQSVVDSYTSLRSPSSPRPTPGVPSRFEPGDVSDAGTTPAPESRFTATVTYQYIFRIDSAIPTHEQSKDVQLSLVCDWARYLPPLSGIDFTRQEHDTLLLRCFTYGTSWLLGLVPELFLHDMLYALTAGSDTLPQLRLQHYSPMLHCAIMAFATAFSDNPALCAPETRAVFALSAKQRLDEEFKDPAMSLVRALALLAEYSCGVGEMNTGYMYMGMSFRAVQISTKSDTESDQGLNPFPVSITTDWLFWSAYCYDKLMALEFNRAYDLPVSHPATPLPPTDHGIDSQPWLTEPHSTPSATAAAPPNLITETFHQTSKLMLIGADIIELTCHLQEDTALEEHVVIDIHLQLDTWFNALPEPLLVWARSSAPLPHMIALHIVYWRLILLLHQTQYPKAPANAGYPPQDPTQAQKMPIADLSIKMCDRAVHKIVQLVKMFDDRHGLKFFPRSLID